MKGREPVYLGGATAFEGGQRDLRPLGTNSGLGPNLDTWRHAAAYRRGSVHWALLQSDAMPRAARAASRATRGGYGPRRSSSTYTATGRRRCAARWTAAAAIVFDKALATMQSAQQGLCMKDIVTELLLDQAARARFVSACALRQPDRVPDIIEAVIEKWAGAVPVAGAVPPDVRQKAAGQAAAGLLSRMRTHAGPRGQCSVPSIAATQLPAPTLPKVEPMVWLRPMVQGQKRRPAPEVDARIRRIVAGLHLERLGPLPADAVLVPERAEGRVLAWRRKTGAAATAPPPMALLRALVHSGSAFPTMVASQGDHFWLLALRRWATPGELMSLFGVPEGALVRRLARPDDPMCPRHLAKCIGRAVQPHSAEVALRVALGGGLGFLARGGRPVRYVSACSGIDMFTVALDHVLGPTGWTYEAASERDRSLHGPLVRAYGLRGLSPEAIAPDATQREACAWAPAADIWVCTPPCEAFSRRNHERSDDRSLAAADDFDLMLDYPRYHRPRAIVVENVGEPEASSVLHAGLASIPGYAWRELKLKAATYGGAERVRVYWVGERLEDGLG